LSYVVELSITHVANGVADGVQSRDLPLVAGALIADRVAASSADNFFGAHPEDSNDAEGRLAQLALILRVPLQRLKVEYGR